MTRARLDVLVRFLPIFEDPNFEAGDERPLQGAGPGNLAAPFVSCAAAADAFVEALYGHGWILKGFDWGAWAATPEAKALRDDDTVFADATPEQLARLLTVLVRQDRFVDGALLDAFECGLMLRIVRRAATILDADDGRSS